MKKALLFLSIFLIISISITAQTDVLTVEDNTVTINGIIDLAKMDGDGNTTPRTFQSVTNTILINADVISDASTALGPEIELYTQILLVNIGETAKLTGVPVINEILPKESIQLLKISDTEWVMVGALPPSGIWPVGTTYTQYPGMKSPIELGLPGEWNYNHIDYGGSFFRAEGGNAIAFSVDGNDQAQGDAMRNITGTFTPGVASSHSGFNNGPFYNAGNHNHSESGNSSNGIRIGFDLSRIAGFPLANEFRPINQTIRIWERTN